MAERVDVSVIIPTLDRPLMVERLLRNLAAQELVPDEVLVVDSSEGDDTRSVCEAFEKDAPYPLRFMKAARGLTVQRNAGIAASNGEHLVMLDDDVLLEKRCLGELRGCLGTAEGSAMGGLSGYIVNEWGVVSDNWWNSFMRAAGFFPGNLEPGKYLDWGYPVELNLLKPFEGVKYVDFLPGGCTIWRREVFSHFMPNESFSGYGVGEDKEFSVKAGKMFRLAVCGSARLEHHHVSGGGRPHPFVNGFSLVRNMLYIYRFCLEKKGWRNTLRLFCYFYLEAFRMFATALRGMKLSALPKAAGLVLGAVYYAAVPPVKK